MFGFGGNPIVELKHPVSARQLSPSLRENGRLEALSGLDAKDCQVIDAFLASHPGVCLRVRQELGARKPLELEFLRDIPSLRDAWLCADAGNLIDLAPLANLPRELRALTLDTLEHGSDAARDKPKANPQVLSRFIELDQLCLCGRLQDLAFLSTMARLRSLRLWRNKLKSLAGIEGAAGLRHLELKACGAADLGPLGELVELRSLEVLDQRKLSGLESLAKLPSLERLWLLSCGRGLALPSFAGFRALRVLVLHSMADASNLEAVAAAPQLRCLVLSNADGLSSVAALRPLAGHPTLKEVRIEDARAGAAIAAAYGWKVSYPNFPADEHLK